ILGITMDNATPNDKMVDVLETSLPDFGGARTRTRCFDHVVNLCAKSVLRPFD
ncbi:hypothetical protein L227DRAFT_479725, partial [Lentinus tigrinus ALCF2SS1-6]